MNLCASCNLDFGSAQAFDKHRVGRHEYTFTEGMERGLDDGRRCLDVDEIRTLTDRRGRLAFALNARGLWSTSASLSVADRLRR